MNKQGGRPKSEFRVEYKDKKNFRDNMKRLSRDLALHQRFKLEIERLDELQKEAQIAGEYNNELNIIKTKMAAYFELMPYLLPKLAAIQIDQTKQTTVTAEEAEATLQLMIADQVNLIK